jgi:hypothetical protein
VLGGLAVDFRLTGIAIFTATFWLFNIAMETEACIKLINTRIIWDLVEVGESNPWYLCK